MHFISFCDKIPKIKLGKEYRNKTVVKRNIKHNRKKPSDFLFSE
jgi:hypothetical protein